MVFRGKPSKACERRRARRLRCDLHESVCGQCARANVPCSGYRDTRQLRIVNVTPFVPQSLTLSVDSQARDLFFTYLVPGTSLYWEFLKRNYRPTESPGYLTLAIEAVSLAYLWHQVCSDATLVIARKKYVSAIHAANKVLKSSIEVSKDTVLVATLLLDLFEKITDNGPHNKNSWTCHVNGGLALVKFRGLEHFHGPFAIRVLVRLATNCIISCMASGSPVPDEVIPIRMFLEKYVDIQDPNWQILDVMIPYANLRSKIKSGMLSIDDYIETSLALDLKLQAIELNMPPSWKYSTIRLEHESDRIFDLQFDTYPNRNVCQGRNGIRLVRILLNEHLLKQYLASPTCTLDLELTAKARGNIEALASQICTSVPQYVDCGGAAGQMLTTPPEKLDSLNQTPSYIRKVGAGHTHTPNYLLDCYTLIFPLYVAGRSDANPDMRPWVIKQLHYLHSHFNVRNAEIVAQMLERGPDVDPWQVYIMLGSYAFAA